MNSVIEAQKEFTECFGEITLDHLFSGLELPVWSNEHTYLEKFLDDHRTIPPHQTISPVEVHLSKEIKGSNIKYQFS